MNWYKIKNIMCITNLKVFNFKILFLFFLYYYDMQKILNKIQWEK